MARKKKGSNAFWYAIGGLLVVIAAFVFFTSDSVSIDFSAYDILDSEIDNPDAEFIIEKFNDFQCPACANMATILEQVKANHDNVHVQVRHFPLSQFPHSANAAEASECARDQGRFWAMYNVMFDHQQRLSPPDVRRYARGLELDMDLFDACMENREKQILVSQDQQEGLERGVTGTPGMFINQEQVQFGSPQQFSAYIAQHQQD